jgi:hypothetical protein
MASLETTSSPQPEAKGVEGAELGRTNNVWQLTEYLLAKAKVALAFGRWLTETLILQKQILFYSERLSK